MFVHLHVHTPFSFLDGASDLDRLVQSTAQLGMPALAITDHNNLSAAVRFVKAAEKAGIKPIIGVEVTLEGGYHLTLLAQNREGYANLCKILTRAHLDNERGSPAASLRVISEHARGLIALSGCLRGQVPSLIAQRKFREAKQAAIRYTEIFGQDNFCLEISRSLFPGEKMLNHYLSCLANHLGLKVVATNNVHYAERAEFAVQEILTCIRTLTKLDEPHPERKINAEFYLKSSAEMEQLFRDCPQAISNTLEIAEKCKPFQLHQTAYLPRFDLPKDESASGFLRKLTYQGARRRYGKITEKIRRRLDYELSVIDRLGFSDYFLVVWDVARHARKQGIRYSGRGSAADSAVAYCLYITSVDSIARDLKFERFINPERACNMPDIDIDFDARYRDKVTEYVVEKYGEERVATVCTFNCYHARGAIRDIGKALDFPEGELDRLAKLMPHLDADQIEGALPRFPELRDSQIPEWKFKQLFQFCAALADHPRHIGTHLGGIVISDLPLTTISPLQKGDKGATIIQFDKEDVEDLRLVKLDLLCLRMLSAVEDTVSSVNPRKPLSLDEIPLNDRATYGLLNSGDTAGAFQLESPAQRALQARLKAENIEDVIASVALIRPGPIQGNMVAPFLARRHGKEPITYLHPKLEKILRKTYGVVLFQEQVIEIAVEIAGFSAGEADELRRAMTHHRSVKQMEIIGQNFVRRALSQGISREVAETVFSYIKGYAGYGFCEAHAAAFGDTAYKTAYLLKHYPAHFYAALLSNQPMGFYPSHTLITEAKRRGIEILPLDVSQSAADFAIEEGVIRVGLKQVRGMTEKALDSILEKRPFESPSDFQEKTKMPRDLLENLILCGAFDSMYGNRKRLLWLIREEDQKGGLNLGYSQAHLEGLADYTDWERCGFEWSILGFSPTWHPMEFWRKGLRRYGVRTNEEIKSSKPNGPVKAAGIVIRPHRPPTRSGRIVVFLTLEDETGLLDVTVFEDVYQKHGKLLFSRSGLVIKGGLDRRTANSLVAQEMWALEAT